MLKLFKIYRCEVLFDDESGNTNLRGFGTVGSIGAADFRMAHGPKSGRGCYSNYAYSLSPTVAPPTVTVTPTPEPTSTAEATLTQTPSSTPTFHRDANSSGYRHTSCPTAVVSRYSCPEHNSDGHLNSTTAYPDATFGATGGYDQSFVVGQRPPSWRGGLADRCDDDCFHFSGYALGVSLISIPRDYYAWIPTWGLDKINTAFIRGHKHDYPGGGAALLKATIEYNFGVPIHYYAMVDFSSYRSVVDAVGGVDLVVECPFHDTYPDPEAESGQTDIDLEPGLHHLDGKHALWYVRSRWNTSDFDRHRRQQQVVRAIFHQALGQNMISRI